MKIQDNAMVSLQYELYSADNAELIEKTKEEEPLVFLFGKGMMLAAFEKNLEGLKAGDSFDFKLMPQDAYGEASDEAIQELDKNIFKGQDGKIDEEVLKIGNVVPLMTKDGQRFQAVVLGVENEIVTLDFNHPLAGETLHFKGSIVEVREATEAELSAMLGGGCGCGNNDCEDKGEGNGNCCGEEDHNCGCC